MRRRHTPTCLLSDPGGSAPMPTFPVNEPAEIAPSDTVTVRPGPLATARAQLAKAAAIPELGDGMHQMLATSRRETNVTIPLRRDDGSDMLFGCCAVHD